MNFNLAPRSSKLSWVLSASIILSWIIAATVLDQSALAVQHSRRILGLGAIDGALLEAGEWWRLVTSQFLHVHAPHMLFNALAVLVIGATMEARLGLRWLAVIYFLGGTGGQLASVLVYPNLVSSGASQALMALCGASLVVNRTRMAYLTVALVLAVQLSLDLRAIGAVKAGHGWGFAAGALIGVAVLVVEGASSGRPRHVA